MIAGAMALPKCGLYRTTVDIGGVPAGRLVYFHDHGDPGPGVYPPTSWHLNRATFSPQGVTLPDESLGSTLHPLAPEGLYRVERAFECCPKRCMSFEPGLLVQLGYNGAAEALLFIPKWTAHGLSFPEVGQKIDEDRVDRLAALKVVEERASANGTLH